MKIAALYARTSTPGQEKEETIDSQVAEIMTKVEADGNVLPVENRFTDDGWTSDLLSRPGLDQFRDAAKEGRFQVAYVYDRGRLSRPYHYQQVVIDELEEMDIEFTSLHDIKAVDDESRIMQKMQGIFHEYERLKIAERMRRGKLYKAKNGHLISGQALYGYRRVGVSKDKTAKYEIDEREAGVVRNIFDWIGNEGVSIREVIRKLAQKKIYPRKRKRDVWTKGPVVRLLQCETYVSGVVYYNKTESIVAKNPIRREKYRRVKKTSRKVRPKEEWIPFSVPVILADRDLFDRVQKKLLINKDYANKRRKYNYILVGKIRCGCGSRRVGDGHQNENFYYRCADKIYKFPKESMCRIPGISAKGLETAIWMKIKELLTDPSLVRFQVERWLEKKRMGSPELEMEKQRLTEQLEKISGELLRYARSYGEGLVSFEQYEQLAREAKRKESEVNSLIGTIRAKQDSCGPVDMSVDDLCAGADKTIGGMDWADKKRVVGDIIDKVVILDRRRAELWGHIPLSTDKLGYGPEHRNCGVAERREIHAV